MKTNNTPNFNEAVKAYEFNLNQTRDEFEATDFYESTIIQLSHLLSREGTVRFRNGKVAITFEDGTVNQFTIRVDVYDFVRENGAKVDGAYYPSDEGDFFGLVRQANPRFNGFASKEEYERNLEWAKQVMKDEYRDSDTFSVYAKGEDHIEVVWTGSQTLRKA